VQKAGVEMDVTMPQQLLSNK